MNTTAPSDTPTEPTPDSGPRASRDEIRDLGRLRRSSADRKIAGVAGGLARHLDIDPLILRVAFVVLVFFGGAGLLVYGACWLLVPRDDTGSAPVRLDQRSRSVALIIVGVIAVLAVIGDSVSGYSFPWPLAAIGVLAVLILSRRDPATSHPATGDPATGDSATRDQASDPSSPDRDPLPPPQVAPRNPRKRGPILFWFTMALVAFSEGVLSMVDLAGVGVPDAAYPALAVGLIGLMLVLGAFAGRAGGLILAGLTATLVLSAMTVADTWDGDEVRVNPARASEVSGRYSVGAGDLRLDLRSVSDPASLDGRTIRVEGGIGTLEVLLSDDVDATVDADVNGPGEIDLFGQRYSGFDIHLDNTYDGGTDAPALTIDAQLGAGDIEVTHR